MPTPTSLVRTVAAIDTELTERNGQVSTFEQALEPSRAKARALEERRRAVLIAARVEKKAKAVKELEALTPKTDSAAREVRDIEDCLAELRAQIKSLAGERLVAVRAETQAALTRAGNDQLAMSPELDRLLADLIQKSEFWLAAGMETYQLAADLDSPIGRTPGQALFWIVSEGFASIASRHFERSPLRGVTFTMLSEQFSDPAVKEEKERTVAS